MYDAVPLSFGLLRARLIATIRQRVLNGEITERGFARRIGLSQPHLHHILKGRRSLTVEVADQILAGLEASASELLREDELALQLNRRSCAGSRRPVGIAAGLLGPGFPFPELTAVPEWLFVPPSSLSPLQRPVVVELGEDPSLHSLQVRGRFALLDMDETRRFRVEDGAWYALRWSGAGLLRQLCRRSGRIYIRGQQVLPSVPEELSTPLPERSLLQVVRARVSWIGPDPRRLSPFDYAGDWLEAQRS